MTLFQTLFSFKGRINRKKWWLARLLLVGVLVGVSFILGLLSSFFSPIFENDGSGDIGGLSLIELFIFYSIIVYFIVGLAIDAKRWHDRNKSAWWILIEFFPIIGPFWAFVELGFLKGTGGPNRFGADLLEHS